VVRKYGTQAGTGRHVKGVNLRAIGLFNYVHLAGFYAR